MKRSLAPLNPLRSFEAAARLLSFTAAAEELNVTQTAVSRQVRVLEIHLGQPLFARQAQGIELTVAGRQLYPSISKALDDISTATAAVNRRRRREVLAIQAYSTFSQCWLIRRLSEFQALHPEIDVRLTASVSKVDFELQDIDAAIYSGVVDDPRLHADFLTPIELVPVLSPRLLRERSGTPIDWSRIKLLHSLSRPQGWAAWLQGARLGHVDSHRGHRFENSAMAFLAAIQGAGVALGVRAMVEHYIASGELVAPFDYVDTLPGGYYLVSPQARPPSPALQAFRHWLLKAMTR